MAEEKKAEETPTLPKEELKKEEVKVVDPEKDTEALLAELVKAGVSNVEQLQGKMVASSQAGNLANQLGAIRQENAELKAMVETSQQRGIPEESSGSEESDLNKIMERSVESVLDRREKKQREYTAQIQQATNAMWGKIYNHPKYDIIKNVWEKKFENPNYAMQIQQGLLNPLEEFHNTLNEYWEGIAKRSVDTIKTLQGKGEAEIPHVEGEGRIPQTPGELSQDQERLNELHKKAQKGTLNEEEELEAVVLKTKGLNWV